MALTALRRQSIMPTKTATARRSALDVTPRPITAPLRGFCSNGTSILPELLAPDTADSLDPLLLGLDVVHVELEKMA